MIEKIGEKEVCIYDYTSNFSIKEFIQDKLIPDYFPNIPVNSLNLGFTGIVSEYMSQGIEDAFATSALMMNESFITKAQLPSSIYNNASIFDISYRFATPSSCKFALQLSIDDVIQHATRVKNTSTFRYCIDKDTTIVVGNFVYHLDYDIFIDYEIINGKKQFSVYYNIDETNSIANVSNKYLNYRLTNIDWLVIFVTLQEYSRKKHQESITNNQITVNSAIRFSWVNQLAGFDLFYITPTGQRFSMIKKAKYSAPEIEPFAWYSFIDNNTIELTFSSIANYFQPAFNSSIEIITYSTFGAYANFTEYNNKTGLPVRKKSDRYEYNANTKMTALCYGSSVGGTNIGTLEDLRKDIILAYKTANSISTDADLKAWFETKGRLATTFASELIKKRDDPSGRFYAQFIALKDNQEEIFPTNTLSIKVDYNQFDQINDESEFIISSGHLWEYDQDSLAVKMILNGDNKPAMVSDSALPIQSGHIFVNPFFIKILKNESYLGQYNCLLNDTSFPDEVVLSNDSFYKFQLTTLTIERTFSDPNGKYNINVICVPSTDDDEIDFIESIDESSLLSDNNLRLLLIFKSKFYGDTGYLELRPVQYRNNNSILFSGSFFIKNQLHSDSTVEIDLEKTTGCTSLITTGESAGKVFIDSSESMLNFITLFKTENQGIIFNNDLRYQSYQITNRFTNSYRDLNLFEPLNMMRSTITFSGSEGNYQVEASMIPFIKASLALDNNKMLYFIKAFKSQYDRIKPVLSRLDGFLDLKLINSYGKSNNYFIGPQEGTVNLYDSEIKLNSVYVRLKFRMAVYDRTIYSVTETDVKNEIKKYFNELPENDTKAIHISNLIRIIENNISNVRYIRFLGFNDYDARMQSIFMKQSTGLLDYVPEILCTDNDGIEISEEI